MRDTLPTDDRRGQDVADCLLIMEVGSRRPSWLGSPDAAVVLVQPPEEPAFDFASRAIGTISGLTGRLRRVVVAAGWESGDEVFDARCRIARAAAAGVALKAGSLLFSCHQEIGVGVRHELFAIAGVLIEEVADTRVGVAVRFEDC